MKKTVLKTEKVRSTSGKKSARDIEIIEKYVSGKDQTEIAEEFKLTPTRIGQIIRDQLGKHAKNSILEKSLIELKRDINTGQTHKEIRVKYGASLLRKIKSNLGFNAFEACLEKRDTDVLKKHQEGMTALEIADELGLTRDHIYGILHTAGVRSKPTKAEYATRNTKIVEQFQAGKTSSDLATIHKLTVTNINIILKNMGARD